MENRQSITLGRVVELFETGSNDVLVVRADDTNEEILIPFIRPHYIENIDLTGGVMQVDWEPQWSQVTEDDR